MLNKPYTILKSALFDVSDYVHSGIAIEDIEEIIETALTADGRKGMCRPVPGFLAYDIKTTLKEDDKVNALMDSIVNKLDILLVDEKEKKFFTKN